jgi:RNA polymerase sigma-70 factor (ECF subfamily)
MQTSKQISESRLLQAAAFGDKQAFGTLYQQYLDEIYRFIRYKISDDLVAEDLTEETFIKTWMSLPKIYKKNKKIDNFRAWLYRTAKNLTIDYYRKSKPVANIEDNIEAKKRSPEEIINQKIVSEQLTKAIAKLEQKYKDIIILRFVNQLSHQEVASILEISESNSRILQYRALKVMKEILSNEEK